MTLEHLPMTQNSIFFPLENGFGKEIRKAFFSKYITQINVLELEDKDIVLRIQEHLNSHCTLGEDSSDYSNLQSRFTLQELLNCLAPEVKTWSIVGDSVFYMLGTKWIKQSLEQCYKEITWDSQELEDDGWIEREFLNLSAKPSNSITFITEEVEKPHEVVGKLVSFLSSHINFFMFDACFYQKALSYVDKKYHHLNLKTDYQKIAHYAIQEFALLNFSQDERCSFLTFRNNLTDKTVNILIPSTSKSNHLKIPKGTLSIKFSIANTHLKPFELLSHSASIGQSVFDRNLELRCQEAKKKPVKEWWSPKTLNWKAETILYKIPTFAHLFRASFELHFGDYQVPEKEIVKFWKRIRDEKLISFEDPFCQVAMDALLETQWSFQELCHAIQFLLFLKMPHTLFEHNKKHYYNFQEIILPFRPIEAIEEICEKVLSLKLKYAKKSQDTFCRIYEILHKVSDKKNSMNWLENALSFKLNLKKMKILLREKFQLEKNESLKTILKEADGFLSSIANQWLLVVNNSKEMIPAYEFYMYLVDTAFQPAKWEKPIGLKLFQKLIYENPLLSIAIFEKIKKRHELNSKELFFCFRTCHESPVFFCKHRPFIDALAYSLVKAFEVLPALSTIEKNQLSKCLAHTIEFIIADSNTFKEGVKLLLTSLARDLLKEKEQLAIWRQFFISRTFKELFSFFKNNTSQLSQTITYFKSHAEKQIDYYVDNKNICELMIFYAAMHRLDAYHYSEENGYYLCKETLKNLDQISLQSRFTETLEALLVIWSDLPDEPILDDHLLTYLKKSKLLELEWMRLLPFLIKKSSSKVFGTISDSMKMDVPNDGASLASHLTWMVFSRLRSQKNLISFKESWIPPLGLFLEAMHKEDLNAYRFLEKAIFACATEKEPLDTNKSFSLKNEPFRLFCDLFSKLPEENKILEMKLFLGNRFTNEVEKKMLKRMIFDLIPTALSFQSPFCTFRATFLFKKALWHASSEDLSFLMKNFNLLIKNCKQNPKYLINNHSLLYHLLSACKSSSFKFHKELFEMYKQLLEAFSEQIFEVVKVEKPTHSIKESYQPNSMDFALFVSEIIQALYHEIKDPFHKTPLDERIERVGSYGNYIEEIFNHTLNTMPDYYYDLVKALMPSWSRIILSQGQDLGLSTAMLRYINKSEELPHFDPESRKKTFAAWLHCFAPKKDDSNVILNIKTEYIVWLIKKWN